MQHFATRLQVQAQRRWHSPAANIQLLTCAADMLAHPIIGSIAILAALALRPSVFVLGGILIVFNAATLPGPPKGTPPAPTSEVRLSISTFPARLHHQHFMQESSTEAGL